MRNSSGSSLARQPSSCWARRKVASSAASRSRAAVVVVVVTCESGTWCREPAERRLAEGGVVAGVQDKFVPQLAHHDRGHPQPHLRAAGGQPEPLPRPRLDRLELI